MKTGLKKKNITKLSAASDYSIDLQREIVTGYTAKINSLLQNHEEKFEQLELKNKKALIELDANTFHLQGRSLYNEKDYLASLGSYLIAGKYSKECGRIDRIGINLDGAIANLKKFKENDFNKLNNFLIQHFECRSLEESMNELETNLSPESVLILKISEIRDLVRKNKSA